MYIKVNSASIHVLFMIRVFHPHLLSFSLYIYLSPWF